MSEQRIKALIGTLAHNRAFQMREIDQYTRFDPEPLNGLRITKDLIRREYLSRIENSDGPSAYFPTRKGWNWIEKGEDND